MNSLRTSNLVPAKQHHIREFTHLAAPDDAHTFTSTRKQKQKDKKKKKEKLHKCTHTHMHCVFLCIRSRSHAGILQIHMRRVPLAQGLGINKSKIQSPLTFSRYVISLWVFGADSLKLCSISAYQLLCDIKLQKKKDSIKRSYLWPHMLNYMPEFRV